jgi:hypothetical protein
VISCEASLKDSPLHRKRESQHHVSDYGTLRSQLVADCVWLTIPKPTEWEYVGNWINAAFVCARADLVNVHGDLWSRWLQHLARRAILNSKTLLLSQVCANLSRIMSAKSLRLASDDSITFRKSSQLIASNSTSVLARIEAFRRASVKSPISPK